MADYTTTLALALFKRRDADSLQIREFPVPELAPSELLIANVAVAQNPGDWKRIAYDVYIGDIPWVIGSDIAGTVVRVGSKVTKFQVGDRALAWACRFPGTARHSGYQTLTIVEEGLTAALPESYSYEQGATIPQAFITAACGLVHGLKIPLAVDAPPNGEPFLVWGGSSSCGAFAVQLAKHAGYTVISTASPANHAYVKSLGATYVFDYRSPTIVADIRAVAGPKLALVFDAIGEDGAIEASAECIGVSEGGLIATSLMMPTPSGELLPVPEETSATLAARGIKVVEAWALHVELPDVRQQTYDILERLLQSGKLVANPVKVIPGGLNGIKEGLRLSRENKVSGEKLVYRIAETRV
ncbi:GroES-like protein [Auricularia subglabra TFB-10046 SS5]|nr:GroES-like protein [Auricularia subglabra TFB-10046 SS5]